jgi:hypothetical protein
MSIETFGLIAATPAVTRSVQRGSVIAAGDITISAVDPSKTVVFSYSNGSAGSASVNANVTGNLTPNSGFNVMGGNSFTKNFNSDQARPRYSDNRSLSGGTTNLVVESYGVYLKNSTTITATGPCRYEVLEYS